MDLYRVILCPFCGAELRVPAGDIPDTYKLPQHPTGPRGNICAAHPIAIVIGWDHCMKCGCRIMSHETGMCQKCYGHAGDIAEVK